MTKINDGKERIVPKTPVGVRNVSYCTKTGLLPGEYCGEDVSGCWFISENVPSKVCEDKHLPEGEETDEENADDTETTESPEEITIPGEGEQPSESENQETVEEAPAA